MLGLGSVVSVHLMWFNLLRLRRSGARTLTCRAPLVTAPLNLPHPHLPSHFSAGWHLKS